MSTVKEMDIVVGRFEVEPRCIYAVFRAECQAQDFVYSCESLFKSALAKIGGGVIWWRIRPEIAEYDCKDGGSKFSKVYFRIATTPELSEEFWQTIESMKDEVAGLECETRAAPAIAKALGVTVDQL